MIISYLSSDSKTVQQWANTTSISIHTQACSCFIYKCFRRSIAFLDLILLDRLTSVYILSVTKNQKPIVRPPPDDLLRGTAADRTTAATLIVVAAVEGVFVVVVVVVVCDVLMVVVVVDRKGDCDSPARF